MSAPTSVTDEKIGTRSRFGGHGSDAPVIRADSTHGFEINFGNVTAGA
jgi:hypothetical protein